MPCVDYFKKTKASHDLIYPMIMFIETQDNHFSIYNFIYFYKTHELIYTQPLRRKLAIRKIFPKYHIRKLQVHRCAYIFQQLKSR